MLIRASDVYPSGVASEMLGIEDDPSAVVASGHIGESISPNRTDVVKTFLGIALVLFAVRLFYDMLPNA